ncbi:hypothetical protein ACLOJK_041611 [Asimina triloba]
MLTSVAIAVIDLDVDMLRTTREDGFLFPTDTDSIDQLTKVADLVQRLACRRRNDRESALISTVKKLGFNSSELGPSIAYPDDDLGN